MINHLLEENLLAALNAAAASLPTPIISKDDSSCTTPAPAISRLSDTISNVDVNDLSCSSSASTVLQAAALSLAATTTTTLLRPAVDDTIGRSGVAAVSEDDDEVPLISAAHVARAVDFFTGLIPATTTMKALAAARLSIQQILTSLLEKGFCTIEHVICAMALAARLHPAALLQECETCSIAFPSMASHEFPFLPSTSRRAIIGLLRLVAKGHGDVYYSISDMLTAVDISVTGDLVGMTARCEWRLFDALGGDVGVSPQEYVAMVNFLEDV